MNSAGLWNDGPWGLRGLRVLGEVRGHGVTPGPAWVRCVSFPAGTGGGEAGLEAQDPTSTLWSGIRVSHLQSPHFYNKTSPN